MHDVSSPCVTRQVICRTFMSANLLPRLDNGDDNINCRHTHVPRLPIPFRGLLFQWIYNGKPIWFPGNRGVGFRALVTDLNKFSSAVGGYREHSGGIWNTFVGSDKRTSQREPPKVSTAACVDAIISICRL